MDMLATALRATGSYSDTDVLLFEKEVQIRDVGKGDCLLTPGQVCQSVFFNLQGAFYQYTYVQDIEQSIIDLHAENEWFLNSQSFAAQTPSDTFIAAYMNSKVLELTIHAVHRLIARSPAFFQLGIVIQQANARVHFFDNGLTPSQKYDYILEHRRQLIQLFPLKMIASYLKISPETLSRVREKIASDKPIS